MIISGVLTTCCLAETGAAPVEATAILDQAQQLLKNRRIDEARTLLTGAWLDAIRKSNPVIDAAVLNDLGLIFYKQGMFRDAEDAYNRAIGLLKHAGGSDTPELIDPLANLANLSYESAQFSRAETLLTREIAILDAVNSGGPDKRSVIAQSALAKVYLSQHKDELAAEAAANLVKARDESDKTLRLGAAMGYSVLGSISARRGRFPAAEALLRDSLSILETTLGPNDVRVSEGIANLGLLYADTRDLVKAEPLLQDAYERLNATRANSLFLPQFLLRYAETESRSGHKKKAQDLLNEARSRAAGGPASVLSRYVVDASAYH